MTAGLFRSPRTSSIHSHGSRASDGGGTFWLADGGWNVTKLLEVSDTMRAALAMGRKLTFGELEELNFVLDMMVRITSYISSLVIQEKQPLPLLVSLNPK